MIYFLLASLSCGIGLTAFYPVKQGIYEPIIIHQGLDSEDWFMCTSLNSQSMPVTKRLLIAPVYSDKNGIIK